MTRVLYLGSTGGTSGARFAALLGNGIDARIVDPFNGLPVSRLSRKWAYKTGAYGLSPIIDRYVLNTIGEASFDLIIVDNGELVGPSLVKQLKQRSRRVVNLNQDNPYSHRDGLRFRLFAQALPEYDVLFCPRRTSIASAMEAGAKKAVRFWFAADDYLKDVAQHPSNEERMPYKAAVSFTGTWMEDRHEFLAGLLAHGIQIKINGPRWNKAPNFEQLRGATRLGSLSQRQFYSAIAASDISIGLLSSGNLDEHTTRSMEIPALRSVLVAQRTREHMELYVDGEEAFFWDSIDECAQIIQRLLANPMLVGSVKQRGYERAMKNDHFNQPLMSFVVEQSLQ